MRNVMTGLSFFSIGLRNAGAAFANPLLNYQFGALSRGGAKPANSVARYSSTTSTASSCSFQYDISQGLEMKEFGGIKYQVSAPRNRHQVIFILGGPGAGKGTQCDKLLDHYSCIRHFSVGELLRNASGPQKELIDSYLVSGSIVPVEISLGLLEKAMSDETSASQICLVDGFPRNYDNLEGWNKIMSVNSDVLGVFLFDCPVEELERRILSRGETSGRSDDNIASARKR